MNRYSRGCLAVLLAFVTALFVLCVMWPTIELVSERWQISRLLAHAQSVELVHYNEALGTGSVYADKKLDPSQFNQVVAAFPLRPDIGVAGLVDGCLFDPHHKIVITGPDGKQTILRVCFECDHVQIGNEPIFATPYLWREPLRKFFATEDMANDPRRYRDDLHRMRQERQEQDKANGLK